MKKSLLIVFLFFPFLIFAQSRINNLPTEVKDKNVVYYSRFQKKLLAFNIFTKIENFFSKLFYKKREFNIKIPIPPPPPPPGYNITQKKSLQMVNPKKKGCFPSKCQ